jgi:hypothetical protein
MEDIQTRIQNLETRHKELEYNIAWGYSNYINDADMSKMKKEKLMIKDQLDALKQHV